MTSVENGWITMEQYRAAYNSRIHENRIQNTELYVVSFRLNRDDAAVRSLVRVHLRGDNPVVGLALDLTLLDFDMQDIYTTAGGVMFDGVWNTTYPLHVGNRSKTMKNECADGVLVKDDGLQVPQEWLREASDLSRPRILETTSH